MEFESDYCESDYYESEIAWDIESSEQLSVLENHLNSIINLTKIVVDEPTKIDLFVMLHAHIVATMMSYFNGFKEPAYIFKINVKHLLIHFFGFFQPMKS
jgi:hypothetical protein